MVKFQALVLFEDGNFIKSVISDPHVIIEWIKTQEKGFKDKENDEAHLMESNGIDPNSNYTPDWGFRKENDK